MGRAWRKLLFAADFSESSRAARDEVTDLALRFDAEVIVTNVQPSPWRAWVSSHLDTRHRADRLELLAEKLRHAGVRARARFVADGEVAGALLGLAEYEGADLIVLGASERPVGPLRRTTAETLVRHARIPIWVSQGQGASAKHVVCGVDGSSASRQALHLAEDLRRALQAKLTVVHALGNPRFNPLGLSASEVAERTQEFRADAQAHMDAFVRDAGLRNQEVLLLWGEPAIVLCAVAEEERASLIVAGRTGKGSVRRLVLGSTAEQLLRRPCRSLVLLGEGNDPLFEEVTPYGETRPR